MTRLALVAIVTFALAGEAIASQVSEDVPVPGGLAALARALDIAVPDRARCLPEVARIVYGDAAHGRKRDGSA